MAVFLSPCASERLCLECKIFFNNTNNDLGVFKITTYLPPNFIKINKKKIVLLDIFPNVFDFGWNDPCWMLLHFMT